MSSNLNRIEPGAIVSSQARHDLKGHLSLFSKAGKPVVGAHTLAANLNIQQNALLAISNGRDRSNDPCMAVYGSADGMGKELSGLDLPHEQKIRIIESNLRCGGVSKVQHSTARTNQQNDKFAIVVSGGVSVVAGQRLSAGTPIRMGIPDIDPETTYPKSEQFGGPQSNVPFVVKEYEKTDFIDGFIKMVHLYMEDPDLFERVKGMSDDYKNSVHVFALAYMDHTTNVITATIETLLKNGIVRPAEIPGNRVQNPNGSLDPIEFYQLNGNQQYVPMPVQEVDNNPGENDRRRANREKITQDILRYTNALDLPSDHILTQAQEDARQIAWQNVQKEVLRKVVADVSDIQNMPGYRETQPQRFRTRNSNELDLSTIEGKVAQFRVHDIRSLLLSFMNVEAVNGPCIGYTTCSAGKGSNVDIILSTINRLHK